MITKRKFGVTLDNDIVERIEAEAGHWKRSGAINQILRQHYAKQDAEAILRQNVRETVFTSEKATLR